MHRFPLRFLIAALNFIAFGLLLLVSLSGIYIPQISLLALSSSTPTSPLLGDFRFGVFGYCDVSTKECSAHTIGYSVPYRIIASNALPTSGPFLKQSETSPFLFHPICAGVSFICTILSLRMGPRGVFETLNRTLAVVNMKFITIAFITDAVVCMNVRERLSGGPIVVLWGAMPWMSLAAFVLIFISLAILARNTFIQRRLERDAGSADDKFHEMAPLVRT